MLRRRRIMKPRPARPVAKMVRVEGSGAGLATSAAAAGVSSWKIRAQTGHASDAMLRRYIRDGEMFVSSGAA